MKKTWNFAHRLAAGFSLLASMTVVMGLVAYLAIASVVEQKDYVITHTAANLIDAESLRGSLQRAVANLRGYLLTGKSEYLTEMRLAREMFDASLARIAERGGDPSLEAALTAITALQGEHQAQLEGLLTQPPASATDATARYSEQVAPVFYQLLESVRAFVDMEQSRLQSARNDARRTASRATTVLVISAIVAALLALAIALLLTRLLSRQIGSSVQHVRSSAAELQATASQQLSSAKEQVTSMNEISTTIGELLASSRQIAESAQRVSSIAMDTADGAESGDRAVANAQEALDDIQAQVQKIVHHMLDLGRKSQQIGGILDIIKELSEQTNILAINATIEAAGAGEAGKRFAVVGEEIRKLSDRVDNSTREIRKLIEEIHEAVNTTVMTTETGSKAVEEGTRRFGDLTAAFKRFGDSVETTTEAAREIELSTKQQATAIEQVNTAIGDAALATKETESGSGQTLQTASELASLSDELARLVRARKGG